MKEYPVARMSTWDAYAERARVQLPAAPEGLLSAYVQWAPWLAIVFGAFGLIATLFGLLVTLGLGATLGPLLFLGGVGAAHAAVTLIIGLVLGLVLSVAEIAGGYLMLKRQLTGWWLLAVGLALDVIQSLFGISLIGLIIALLIAYVHLEVKPRYS